MTITSIVVSVSHTVSRVITVDGSIDKTQPSIRIGTRNTSVEGFIWWSDHM